LKVGSITLSDGNIDKMYPEQDYELKCTINQLIDEDYVLCPGISDYKDLQSSIRFHPKHVRQWTEQDRTDSEQCHLWHKQSRSNYKYTGMCSPCVSLLLRLNILKKNVDKKSTPDKRLSQRPSSNRPLKFMSPNSQKKRKNRQSQERRNLKQLLKKMKGTDIELNEDQSEEMQKIGNIIQDNHSSDLNDVFDEVSEFSETKKKMLQQVWNLDINERKDFTSDQIRNGFGCRGNRYSMISYRIALAIYIRSPAAYKSLCSFNMLKLPSRRSLQKFVGHHLEVPGECDKYLLGQKKKYTAMCEQLEAEGKPVPDGFGALIFDEVKVIAKVLWNSKNNALIGYAMTPEEMSSLHDIYLHLDEGKQNKTKLCSAVSVERCVFFI
jgi:hypothetical protein